MEQPRATVMSAPPGGLPSGTVTFLFTDIEGSSERWERERAAMQEAVRRHDGIMRFAIATHQGQVFKTMGDAFCAVFLRPEDAVSAALDAQRTLAAEGFSSIEGLHVRMALHTGTADERDGDYFGPAVNRVARLLVIGHGGQVLVSGVTSDLVHGSMPAQTTLRDLGEHRLKDLARAEQVYQLVAPGLEETFPALCSLEALPNNLPQQVSSFVGRDDEVAEITALVNAHRLVTLVGTGGVGKTRTALQVAANLLDGSADGVWLVELAPLSDPLLVAGEIAAVLGVRQRAERPIRQTLLEFLQRRKLLLVLDNCEHLVAEAASIADQILHKAPQVHLLATSREALGVGGERVYRMPSLAVPAPEPSLKAADATQYGAVALFAERAGAADARFALTDDTAPIVGEICRRLDGIPLAIELAAARVKVLSIPNLAKRLDERFRILTGGSRTALPRQQTMRALIDWSYDLLSAQERTLFRRLGVFVDGWTLEAAENVTADDAPDALHILDLLSSLVEKSLVIAELSSTTARYRLLESTRAYALHKVAETGELPMMARRHAQWVADFADREHERYLAMPHARWIADVSPEIGNVRAAMEWALGDDGDPLLAGRIAGAVPYLWDSGERRRWLEAVVAKLDEVAEPAVAARALCGLASTLPAARKLEAAERAVAIQERIGDRAGLASSLNHVASAFCQMARFAEAETANDRGLRILRQLGLRRSRQHADSLAGRGILAAAQDRCDEARQFLNEAITLAEALGDFRDAAIYRGNLAEVEFNCGDAQRALELAQAAARAEPSLQFVGSNAAAYRIVLGDLDGARIEARDALLVAQRQREIELFAPIQHLGTVAALQDDVRRGARLLGYADAWCRRESWERDPTERRTREILVSALHEKLSDVEIEALTAEGAMLSEDDAIAEALTV
ncbi:MAG: AAA family ATPase [Candidatus Eremiobacteraeota bacterium]|nr:AAA family ATPase [Candidatus Eremiobacteraeota bacterium]